MALTAMARARAMGETELRARVRGLVDERGLYLKAHPDSRRDRESTPGFPDLFVVGIGGHLLAELKDQDDTASRAQLAWADVLRAAGLHYRLWRPLDLLSGVIRIELDALTVAYDPATIGRPLAT